MLIVEGSRWLFGEADEYECLVWQGRQLELRQVLVEVGCMLLLFGFSAFAGAAPSVGKCACCLAGAVYQTVWGPANGQSSG